MSLRNSPYSALPRARAGTGRLAASNDTDPRQSAEIIDLATRHVLPTVTQRQPRSDALVLVGGFAVIAMLGAVTFWGMNSHMVNHAAAPVPPAPAAAPAPPPAWAHPATPLAQPLPMPARAPLAMQSMPAYRPMSEANPLASPTVVFDASAMPALAPAPAPLAAPGAPATSVTNATANDEFAARLGTTGSGAATASATINPKTTVAQGTLIPAVLETAIDTDVPGYCRAIVSTDVRSFDGTRVLVPRSSRLVGQYKSGLQAGQRRIYVIWTRLIRPDGVSVNLGSPATGFDGESGLSGSVNTHFFDRFGSAMLLTVMSGLSAIGSGGTSVIIAGSGQSAASAAVGQTGQIGPTIRVHPGEPVRVFTARDLDFAKVTTE